MDTISFVGWLPMAGNPGLSYKRTRNLSSVAWQVKATEGSIFQITLRHPNTTPVYVNIYDLPLTSVTVGTTVPIETLMVPEASATTPGQLIITAGPYPLYYCKSGICLAVVTTDSDTGSTSPASDTYAAVQYA